MLNNVKLRPLMTACDCKTFLRVRLHIWTCPRFTLLAAHTSHGGLQYKDSLLDGKGNRNLSKMRKGCSTQCSVAARPLVEANHVNVVDLFICGFWFIEDHLFVYWGLKKSVRECTYLCLRESAMLKYIFWGNIIITLKNKGSKMSLS